MDGIMPVTVRVFGSVVFREYFFLKFRKIPGGGMLGFDCWGCWGYGGVYLFVYIIVLQLDEGLSSSYNGLLAVHVVQMPN